MVKKIIKKKFIFIIFIFFLLCISFIALFNISQDNEVYSNVIKFRDNYLTKINLINYEDLIKDKELIENEAEKLVHIKSEELAENVEDEKSINETYNKESTNNTKSGEVAYSDETVKPINDAKSEEITSNTDDNEKINKETSIKGSFDNVMCGHWQEQYTRFHRQMETSDKKKYLILDAYQCGWGDRLIQIVSGFYVALLSKRAFKIIGVDLENVFEKPNIDWTLDEKELKRLEKNESVKELYYTSNEKKYYDEGFLYTNFTSNYEVSKKKKKKN